MTLDDWLAARRVDRAQAGLTRQLHPQPARSPLIDLAGNDYLGLRTDPRVTAAAADAARIWGAGAGASRLVTGTLELHSQLEAELARFTGRESALLFSTGYAANLGVVTALTDRDTLIVSDAHVHASLVDACRLARATRIVVAGHNDVAEVTRVLSTRTQARAVVLVESVYSVLGDAAPLPELARICGAFDAVLVVDEAHALGVAGRGGRGLVEAAGLSHRRDVVSTLTLSKSLGSQGGAALGSGAVIEHLLNTARSFIYDTGLAPAATGAALESLRIVTAEPERPRRALDLAAAMSSSLTLPPAAGSVLSVPMRSPADALRSQAELADEGFLVGCFRPPSVPDGISRLRLTAPAGLSDEQAARVVRQLAAVPTGR
jgi:8-amino-7-oxononanoate synthase